MSPNLGTGATMFLAETLDCPSSLHTGSVPQSYSNGGLKTRVKVLSLTNAVPTPTPAANKAKPQNSSAEQNLQWQIVWRNVIAFIYLHVATLYGIYLSFTVAKGYTVLWAVMLAVLGGLGITAGAHRLWAHRSYKAKWPLRLLLAVFQTLAFQNHIYEWVRDHRVHHKFTDTNADPHNASRGFFFSHIGWLMVRKHPDVKDKGKLVQMSDLENDPIVMFQKRYYLILMPVTCFVIPSLVPYYFWGETFSSAWHVAAIMRYTLALNGTWLVNSAAHIWGTRPIDKAISPTENIGVAWLAFGEGWHNYHHVFPYDYKAAELGDYRGNLTTALIDFMAKIGWAYDMKTVSAEWVARKVGRSGDGTHKKYPVLNKESKEEDASNHSHGHNPFGTDVWGWGDSDMNEEFMSAAQILNKQDT